MIKSMKVPSSKGDQPYQVEAHDFGSWWSCTCPHWQFRLRQRRGRCKHIDFVIAFEKKQYQTQLEICRMFEHGWGFDWDDPPKPDLYLDEETA